MCARLMKSEEFLQPTPRNSSHNRSRRQKVNQIKHGHQYKTKQKKKNHLISLLWFFFCLLQRCMEVEEVTPPEILVKTDLYK